MEELDGENRTEGHVLGVEAKGVWLVVRGNNELDEPATDRVTVQVKSFWLRAIMSGQHVGVAAPPSLAEKATGRFKTLLFCCDDLGVYLLWGPMISSPNHL